MLNKTILTITAFLAVSSCEKKNMEATYIDETKTETAAAPATAGTTTAALVNATSGTTMNVSTQPGQPIQINPSAAAPSAPAATKTAPGMNPPHGEPGHRCDIPVGSSLSQPVQNPAAAAPAAPVIPQQTQVVPQNTAAQPTAPGMNPPHGQPGHRCDIPVGSPLK